MKIVGTYVVLFDAGDHGPANHSFFSIQGFIATSLWPLGLRFGGPADRIVVFLKFDSLIMNIIEDLMVWEWMTID